MELQMMQLDVLGDIKKVYDKGDIVFFWYSWCSCWIIFNRFMDSELDLNDEIQKLHVIATVPHLYQNIVDVNAVGTILGLLSHENSGEV